MMENRIVLHTKTGWKVYMLIGGVVGLLSIGYMLYEFWNYQEYMGAQGYALMVFFGVLSLLFVFNMLYAQKHLVEIGNESVILKGIFRDRVIPIQKLAKVQVSNSLLKGGGHHSFLGTQTFLHLDYKYTNKEEAVEFLKKMADEREDVDFTLT